VSCPAGFKYFLDVEPALLVFVVRSSASMC
jgi:hypothetical protein